MDNQLNHINGPEASGNLAVNTKNIKSKNKMNKNKLKKKVFMDTDYAVAAFKDLRFIDLFVSYQKMSDEAEVELTLPKETYYGNVEYKLMVMEADMKRLNKLATQMIFRLNEGRGCAYY